MKTKEKIELRAKAQHRLPQTIERLAQLLQTRRASTDKAYQYRIEIKDMGDDSVRFCHHLIEGQNWEETHSDGELFDIGLILMEELQWGFHYNWTILHLYFAGQNNDYTDWQLYLDEHEVAFLI